MIKRSLAPSSLLLRLHPLVPKRCRRRLIVILSVPMMIAYLDHIGETSAHHQHVLQLQVLIAAWKREVPVLGADHMLLLPVLIKNCNVRLVRRGAGGERAVIGGVSESDVEHLFKVVQVLGRRDRAN